MTPRDDLFRLIESLTLSEKQAFAKSSIGARKKPPKYYLLFQALSELKEYDEHTFLASKRGAPFKSNYPVQKKELFDKIMAVIRGQQIRHGHEKPIEFKVRDYIEDAIILREKKLFDICKNRLEQARNEAEEYQLHEVHLEILRQERSLKLEIQAPGYEEDILALHEEIAQTSLIIQNKYRLLHLRDQLFLPSRRHAAFSTEAALKNFEEVLRAPELKNAALCLSFEATSNYHFCHAIYHHLCGNPMQAWIHFRSIYLMWQEHKPVQRIKPVDYRNMIQNYLNFCNDALRYEDFDNALGHLKREPFQSSEEQAIAEQYSLYIRLQRHLNLCEWQAALAVYDEYKKALPVTADTMGPSRMMSFYMSFSRLFFIQGAWKDSRAWAQKVINEADRANKEALVIEARILEMLALFEEGETIAITKSKRLTLDAIGKAQEKESLRKAVEWLAKHAGKTLNDDRQKELQGNLSQLRESHGTAVGTEFLSAWLQSKVEKKSISEIFIRNRDEKLKNSNRTPPAS